MSTDTEHGDVLSELDDRSPTAFYWKLTLLSTLGGFLFGYDTSNIGAALNFVPYHLSGFWQGYLVAGASIGAAVGAFTAGPITDRLGRKKLLVADAAIYALGAILSAVTPDAAVLLGARTLIGLAIGADSAIATAYIAEYAPKGRRGSLAMLQQWMITVGILVAYIVALVILRAAPGSAGSVDWRLILGLGAVPALIGLVLRSTMPESPRWLMSKGRYAEAAHALRSFGVQATESAVKSAKREERREGRRAHWTPGLRRALSVVCGFFVFQQITGINVPLYYGPHLLGPIFQGSGSSKVASTVAGVEVTSIMTAVNVAATYFGFRYIDRIGRRKLAIGGFLGMAVFALVAAAGLGILSGDRPARAGDGGPGLLHRLLRDRRRRHRLAVAGRGLPDRRPRTGGGDRSDRRLARQLRADRGVPRLELRHRPRLGARLLRRPVRPGDRVRHPLPAGDQGALGRGDRGGLRARGRRPEPLAAKRLLGHGRAGALSAPPRGGRLDSTPIA